MSYNTAEKDHERKATTWACQTLALLCCDLLSIPGGGWDVETPLGWKSANDWRELCDIAHEVQRHYQSSRVAERKGS